MSRKYFERKLDFEFELTIENFWSAAFQLFKFSTRLRTPIRSRRYALNTCIKCSKNELNCICICIGGAFVLPTGSKSQTSLACSRIRFLVPTHLSLVVILLLLFLSLWFTANDCIFTHNIRISSYPDVICTTISLAFDQIFVSHW